MFLIGVRREIANGVAFPSPTHWIDLPPGYEGSRSVALKLLRGTGTPDQAFDYVEPPTASEHLPPAITAEEAIGDLPPIYARELLRAGELKRGARRFDKPIPWGRRRRVTDYARMMRNWSGFEAADVLMDHVIRYLPRDYELFARMNPGDQYPEAWKHAHDMLEENLAKLRNADSAVLPESAEYQKLLRQYVPPYDVNKFPNKWRKMWRDAPARTLMAHLGKDGYSHIHYDSEQARTISVREAARLQSFPDGFVFSGTMNPAFRQIGNAVPPLLARQVARSVLAMLKSQQSEEGDVNLGQAEAV